MTGINYDYWVPDLKPFVRSCKDPALLLLVWCNLDRIQALVHIFKIWIKTTSLFLFLFLVAMLIFIFCIIYLSIVRSLFFFTVLFSYVLAPFMLWLLCSPFPQVSTILRFCPTASLLPSCFLEAPGKIRVKWERMLGKHNCKGFKRQAKSDLAADGSVACEMVDRPNNARKGSRLIVWCQPVSLHKFPANGRHLSWQPGFPGAQV